MNMKDKKLKILYDKLKFYEMYVDQWYWPIVQISINRTLEQIKLLTNELWKTEKC